MILLTGSTGFIGSHYKEKYPGNLLCPTHEELDLTDIEAVKKYLHNHKPEKIIHCASNDHDVCLYDNLRMFYNLAESKIPMITFCTGREIEDRSYKNGEYVLSKRMIKELSLNKYNHISIIQLWGCFGAKEKGIRFFKSNMRRIKQGEAIFIDENRMFSYVYVKDVVRFMKEINRPGLFRLVAYTKFFSEYAHYLAKLTKRAIRISIGNERFSHSYIGINNVQIKYTPLEKALGDMWSDLGKLGV